MKITYEPADIQPIHSEKIILNGRAIGNVDKKDNGYQVGLNIHTNVSFNSEYFCATAPTKEAAILAIFEKIAKIAESAHQLRAEMEIDNEPAYDELD